MRRRRSRTRQTALLESNPLLRQRMLQLKIQTPPTLTGASKKQEPNKYSYSIQHHFKNVMFILPQFSYRHMVLKIILYNLWMLVFRFQAPGRDEESESQRKARSRLLRQTRRSTQVLLIRDMFTSKNYPNGCSSSVLYFYIAVLEQQRNVDFFLKQQQILTAKSLFKLRKSIVVINGFFMAICTWKSFINFVNSIVTYAFRNFITELCITAMSITSYI